MLITRQQIIDIFNAIKTAVEGAIPAGTNLIGKTGIDQVTANANEVVTKAGSVVEVTGSIDEHQWLSTDTAPVLASGDRAYGVEINTTTHVQTVKYWNGTGWEVVS